MKKHIFLFLLALVALKGFSQTYSSLPAGFVPYTTGTYKNADGSTIIMGNTTTGFRVITQQRILDSLLAKVTVLGTLGPDLVTNGTFAGNLTGWSGTNWNYSSGTALHATGAIAVLAQSGTTATIGDTYRVSYKVVGATTGNVKVYFGGVWGGGGVLTPTNVYVNYLTATSTDMLFFEPTSDFNGALDSVSIKKLTTSGNSIFETPVEFRKTITVSNRIDFAEGLPISIGLNALRYTTTGEYNIAASNLGIGFNAARNTTTGHATAAGYNAAYANTTGVITAFGKWAGLNNTTGHASFFGNAAGRGNTTGLGSYFGDESGSKNQTGNVSVFGYYAGNQAINVDISAFGYLSAQNGVSIQGTSAFGVEALKNTSVPYSSGFGHQVGLTNTTGVVTLGGYRAGYNNTTGNLTAFGREAGISNTTGNSVFVGDRAGYYNTSGLAVGVGYEAMRSNQTSGSVGIGYSAGYSNTTGMGIFIGRNAGLYNTTGSLISIGLDAGVGANSANAPVTDSAAVLIGRYANRSVVSATRLVNYIGIGDGVLIDKSHQVKIGNTLITETVLRGNVVRDSGDVFTFLSTSVTVPTPSSTGTKGEIRVIGGFRYFCTATNTWVRSAVDTSW